MATTRYVATSGNDSNAGTIGSPFRTIAKGLSVLFPGDTLFIRAGTYNESINTQSQTVPTGTSWSTPVTIAAYPGEAVTLRPLGAYAVIQIVGNSWKYLIFDRLIIDAVSVSNRAIDLDGIGQSGAGHIRFTNCEIRNSPDIGILTSRGSNFNEFLNCSFHHNGLNPNVGNSPVGHGIYIQTSDNLVEGSEFHHNTGYGVHIYNGNAGQRANNNIVRRTRAYSNSTIDSFCAGILLGSGDGNQVYNCTAYGQPVGIMVGFFNSTNSKVYNNTVYNNSTDGIQIRATSSTAFIKNNIAYANGVDINNYNTTGGTTQANNHKTVNGNPLFVNTGTGDFHLQAGSPCINAGVVLSEVPRDYDGGVRPVGASYDIGAFEYASIVTPPQPVDVPCAPSGLSVTVNASNQLWLTWADDADNESGQEIERSPTGTGSWVRIITVGANVVSYVDATVTPSTPAFYRVRAINAAGPSPYSNIASATSAPAPVSAPAAPSSLTATTLSATTLAVAWTRNATDETEVQIERAVSPFTSFALVKTVGATIVAWTDTGRTPATAYAYRVRNSNGVGNSAYSNTDNATTSAAPGSVPNAPTDLTVTVISFRQLDLMWVLNGGDPDGAEIERSEDGLSYSQLALVVGSGAVYFSDLSCQENTTYWYRMRLYNEAGPSLYSNITNATTPAFDGLVFTDNQRRSLAGLAPFPASVTGTVAYWRHLAGLYRGPFDALTIQPGAPNPNVGIITLWDLHATGGPYYYSSFEPPDGANQYHGRILENVSITKEQPDPYNGIPGPREAQIELSNLNVNPEAPTISEIEMVEDPIGMYAPVRLYDLTEQRDLLRLDGNITSYQPGIATTSVTIAINEPKVLETPLPRKRTADVFPTLDLSTFKTQDPVVLVVFGPWRKAPVGLCRTDNLTYWDYGTWRKATAGLVTAVNVYRDGALVLPNEYTIVEPVAGYQCVRFTLDQMDRGRPLQIVIDFTTTEFSQNSAKAIKFLLGDATFGLGQPTETAAFNTAAITFSSIPIRIGGGLSEQQDARVILRDLLLHGSFLERNQSGAYTLTVDTLALHPQHTDANFQLGFGLEDWHNIPNDPSATIRDESQRLASLSIAGGWDPYFNGNGSYHIHTKRTRPKVGVTKTLDNRFLMDGQSIDRQNHYLWFRTNARDKQLPIDSIVESYVLDVGHLVKTTIPTMQIDHAVYEVIRRTFAGGSSLAFSYLITPWDVAAFHYVPGVIEQDQYATTLLDYRRTPPTQPTGFGVTGYTEQGEAGLIHSVAVCTATVITVNISHMKFVAYRTGSAAPIGEIEVVVPVAALGIGVSYTTIGEITLHAGLLYDFEAFAINKANDADRQESSRATFTNFVAPGDAIPPRPPTHLDATRGSLRTVFLKWVASLDAVKIREYVVERDTDSSFPTPTIVANIKTTNYTDNNTPYDATFYYRVKAVSRAGLSSIWSNLVVMTVVRAQPSDYGKDSQYRFHRAPLNQIISGVVVPAHSSFAFGTGIDATKYEWQAGALGCPQATGEYDSSSYDGGGLPLGAREFVFVASGGFQGPFNVDFWVGFWNGTNDTLNSVVRYMGS